MTQRPNTPQLSEARMAELSSRAACAEEKVTHLKSERARLYQQLAASADSTRSEVRACLVWARACACTFRTAACVMAW
jgi:hypothetical protein